MLALFVARTADDVCPRLAIFFCMRTSDLSAKQDKAVKRFIVRNVIELRDIADSSVYETYALPKFYLKMLYCISCAIHSHIVRVRSHEGRRDRNPPPRIRYNKVGFLLLFQVEPLTFYRMERRSYPLLARVQLNM